MPQEFQGLAQKNASDLIYRWRKMSVVCGVIIAVVLVLSFSGVAAKFPGVEWVVSCFFVVELSVAMALSYKRQEELNKLLSIPEKANKKEADNMMLILCILTAVYVVDFQFAQPLIELLIIPSLVLLVYALNKQARIKKLVWKN